MGEEEDEVGGVALAGEEGVGGWHCGCGFVLRQKGFRAWLRVLIEGSINENNCLER